ncbi:hypothetical protein FN846DRAFT_887503 [Sphaerosporella brunnea]|uniref:SH3 domain-containing protein n=1 Tax=Sphaerosporella brunnea TaxID=1250544 RepID=A0A5J5F644_9PEZI|nr:hypothetical protein FN846DRAFT_887503 [Sphaerosporella brunnea]
MTSSINNNSVYKASLESLLAVGPPSMCELEFLHTNGQINNVAHATVQKSLAGTREKLQIANFVVTCNFAHTKQGEAELHVDKGQVVEVFDDDHEHWFMGRVRGGDSAATRR